jgi:glycosyltransferase involved in cell wall biosynthesis
MKKVVFAATTDLTYDQRMQRICNSLAENNYHVLLLGRYRPGSRPLTPERYQQHRLRVYFTKGKLFYLEYNVRLFLYLLFRKFDAYCAADLDTALPLFLKAKYTHKPFVYDAHEYFPEVIEVTNRPVVKFIWTALEKYLVSRTRYAYTVSQSLAAIFKKKYGVAFEVIRNCTALQLDKKGIIASAPKYLLYQGAVNAGRGLEALLLAMQKINIPLVICGDGDILTDLKQLCQKLNLIEKIFFKGYILPEELRSITAQAFLGINLLENRGLSYYYSLGNKFFDYLHAGVPQLMVDFPEYQYLNDTYQVGCIIKLEPEAIAKTVNDLINQPNLYEQLVQNCRQTQLELNWQNEEKKLLAFYQNIWMNPRP